MEREKDGKTDSAGQKSKTERESGRARGGESERRKKTEDKGLNFSMLEGTLEDTSSIRSLHPPISASPPPSFLHPASDGEQRPLGPLGGRQGWVGGETPGI